MLSLIALAGCTVGPSYEAPALPTGDGWIQLEGSARLSPPAAWWEQFRDDTLSGLIETAAAQNLDIAQAQARVTEARALRARATGGYRPTATANGSVTRQRFSENAPVGAGPDYQTLHDVNLDARWELDLFGQTSRRVEAATARYHAAVERQRDVTVSVIAETARTYYELRGAQLELTAERDALAAADRNRQLIERRYDVGRSSLADLRQAEADVKSIAARLPAIEARRDVAVRALSVLLGELPESRLDLIGDPAPFPALSAVPVGTRSTLLRRRPDIRLAERELAAATADIGVARGELYPKLALTGSGGYRSLASGTLTEPESRTWSLVPVLQWRFFEGGRLRADVAAAGARAEAAAYAYEAAVVGGLSEAEQAIVRYRHQREAVDRQAGAVRARRESRDLIDRRYRAGDVSLLALLDAERQLSTARSALATAKTAAALGMVAVYRSLGGGWEAVEGA